MQIVLNKRNVLQEKLSKTPLFRHFLNSKTILETMEKIVIQRIRTALLSYDLKISFLAEQLNIKPATLISKLNGTRSLDINTLCKILNALPFLSAEWILLGKGEMENLPKKDKPDDINLSDTELKEMYINQGREIHRLKKRIAELEGEKKDTAS